MEKHSLKCLNCCSCHSASATRSAQRHHGGSHNRHLPVLKVVSLGCLLRKGLRQQRAPEPKGFSAPGHVATENVKIMNREDWSACVFSFPAAMGADTK